MFPLSECLIIVDAVFERNVCVTLSGLHTKLSREALYFAQLLRVTDLTQDESIEITFQSLLQTYT